VTLLWADKSVTLQGSRRGRLPCGSGTLPAALAEDRREAWIIERFGDRYPRDLADRDVLEDAITGHFARQSLAVYQSASGWAWASQRPLSSALLSTTVSKRGR